MGIIKKVFGGYKNMMASIAQIILVVIFLPVICFILSLLSGTDDAFSMITNLLGELSITEYWLNLFMLLIEGPLNMSGLDIYFTSVEYVNSAVFEACVIGMCVSLCKNIGIVIGIRGVPIIQSILGIFLGCIIVRFFGLTNDLSSLFFCSMLIILNLIVIWLMSSGNFYLKFLSSIFSLGLQIIVAVLSAGYIVYLTLIMNGLITDLKTALTFLAVIFLPMLIVLAVDFFLLTPEKKSLGL